MSVEPEIGTRSGFELPDGVDFTDHVRGLIERGALETVVVAGADFGGVLRGKFFAAEEFARDVECPATMGDLAFLVDAADGTPVAGPEQGWWPFGGEGFRDLPMRPDPTTFRRVPWADRTALVLCDYTHPDGAPLPVDTRGILRRVLERAEGLGFAIQIGYELEFYVLKETAASLRAKGWDGLDYRSERSFVWTVERGLADEGLLRDLRVGLEDFGLPIQAWTAEAGRGQQELNAPSAAALIAADRALLHRFAVRSIVERRGELATFMAKPPGQEYGSSMHLHQSLWTADGANAFYEPGAEGGISRLARHYVGGQLATLPELTCLLAPTINSYKRLRPWAAAGVDLTWGFENWSTTLRVLCASESSTRIEHRTPGADANPYLAVAATILGGLHGIENGIEPPEPIRGAGYESGAGRVPSTLEGAIDLFEQSELANEVLGEEFVAAFVATRRAEVEAFAGTVTAWEAERYLEGI